MLITRISDDELLPIAQQLIKIELDVDCCTNEQRIRTRAQLTRLYHRLNREFSKCQVSVFDYVDLSLKLSKQRAAIG
jgi:hypothetical protein